jgi:hypothetical protein
MISVAERDRRRQVGGGDEMTRRRLVGLSRTATDHEGHVAEGVGSGKMGTGMVDHSCTEHHSW